MTINVPNSGKKRQKVYNLLNKIYQRNFYCKIYIFSRWKHILAYDCVSLQENFSEDAIVTTFGTGNCLAWQLVDEGRMIFWIHCQFLGKRHVVTRIIMVYLLKLLLCATNIPFFLNLKSEIAELLKITKKQIPIYSRKIIRWEFRK